MKRPKTEYDCLKEVNLRAISMYTYKFKTVIRVTTVTLVSAQTFCIISIHTCKIPFVIVMSYSVEKEKKTTPENGNFYQGSKIFCYPKREEC